MPVTSVSDQQLPIRLVTFFTYQFAPIHGKSENVSRCHVLPACENTVSRDHMLSVMQGRAVDMTTRLGTELDSITYPESEKAYGN